MCIEGYGFAHELGHNFGSWHNIELYGSIDKHVPAFAHGLRIPEDPSVSNRHPGQPEYDGQAVAEVVPSSCLVQIEFRC